MRDALGNVQSVLVFGGGSDIALATIRRLVEHRVSTVVLAARHPSQLARVAAELRAAGVRTVEVVPFDAEATDTHGPLVDELFDRFGDIDLVLLAFGVLGAHGDVTSDPKTALEIARVNYVGTVSVAVPVANRMRQQGHGTIVGLSSVSGERARKARYVYGSSKAAMDTFLQGLGDALLGTGVRVMVVRPGFVHSKMTEGIEPVPFATTPDAVAGGIVAGLRRGREIIWVPPILRYAMSVLRHIPRPIFRRLPL